MASILVMPFVVAAAAIIFAIVFVIVRSVNNPTSQQNKANTRAPLLESLATVVDKREEVHGASLQYGGTTLTTYYVTFQLPDAQRLELTVLGPTSGQLVVGDTGQLTWQGTWFRGFQRQVLR